MKVFSQLEKAQLENTTSDTGSLPKGMITYRTDLNIAKVSNGTSMLALIDESSTQTLSGKTYATPNFTGAFNMAQTTTPANPSAGNNKFYFKADGKLYTLDSSGNEALVGSGTGGVKNLITNGNADDTAASIFVPYADTGTRPVDGTGGSPTVTTSISSSTPLDGVKSFLLTKPASNVQGQGWAVPFTVDPAYRAKSLKISVDYIVNSGTFVAGGAGVESDVIWYIYDVTNSVLIEPSNIKMFSNSSTIADKFEATFQSSSTGASYRLIAHVASTSALAYELKVDNVTVSPQVYVFGTPVTDWSAFTATFTNFSASSQSSFMRRVGDSIEVQYHFVLSGAPTGTLYIHLPSGISVDTTKIDTTSNLGIIGEATANDGVAVNYVGHAQLAGTGYLRLVGPNGNNEWGVSNPFSFGAGDVIAVKIKVPVQGWSSSVQTSDNADTRIIAACYTLSVDTAANSAILKYDSKLVDTHTSYNTSTGIYTVPVSGIYEVTAKSLSTSQVTEVRLRKNGVVQARGGDGTTANDQSAVTTVLMDCKAGDTIDIFNNTTATFYAGANDNIVTIKRLSGPSAIAASELVGMSYENTAGTSITTSNSTITFATKNFDTHNAYSGGVFTAPIAGKYFVSVNMFSVTTLSNTAGWYAKIVKNGSTDMLVNTKAGTGAPNTTNCVAVSGIVELKAGDTLRVDSNLDAAGPISLTASAGYNVFTISRVGM